MRRFALLGLVVLPLLLAAGDTRVRCCHGCGSYYCNRDNCGEKCGMGPHCRGCWKGCAHHGGGRTMSGEDRAG